MTGIVEFLREKLAEDAAAINSRMTKKMTEAWSLQEMTVHSMMEIMPRSSNWPPYELAAVNRMMRRVQIGRDLIAYYEREAGDSRATLEQVLRMFAEEWRT